MPESFRSLTRAPDTEARLLYDTARQMFYEEHVRLLWVMYNCFSTAGGDQPLLLAECLRGSARAAATRLHDSRESGAATVVTTTAIGRGPGVAER